MIEQGQIVTRILIAAALGGAIGLEREWRNQPAGFRTHLILCIGACLVMLTAIFLSTNLSANADPAVMAAHVLSGIGFLGAGAILRLGVSVKGLTTATSLWTIAGIGLAVGAGFYAGAVITACTMLVALILLRKIEKTFLSSSKERIISLSARDVTGMLGKIENTLAGFPVSITSLELEKSLTGGTVEIRAVVKVVNGLNIMELTTAFTNIKDILGVEIH